MLKKILYSAVLLGILTVFGQYAFAHNLFVEPQTLLENPSQAPPKDDFSFMTPFQIDNVTDSQAIFSYLTPGDVDVFEFQITPEDVAFGPVLVSASALPPACLETQNNYPVTALIGPGLPPPPVDIRLPFQVPCDMGVVIANNPVVKKRRASHFRSRHGRTAVGSWYRLVFAPGPDSGMPAQQPIPLRLFKHHRTTHLRSGRLLDHYVRPKWEGARLHGQHRLQ